jgi:hypothetical protein
MAGQEPCLASVEQVGRHGIEDHRREVVAVAVVRHLHILQLQASHRNALVPQVVDERLDLEQRMVGHKLAMGYGDYVQSDGDCRDGHSFRQLVAVRKGQPAYRPEQHRLDHHFEKHRLKLRDHQIVPIVARRECCQHSMLQCEQHQQHRERQGNVQWTAGDMHRMRSIEHQKHLGSRES